MAQAPAPFGTARPGRLTLAAILATLVVTGAGSPTVAQADDRCTGDLQHDVCLEANPVCPAYGGPVGVTAGTWPAFQRNVQHTGQSPHAGPSCNNVLWSTKLTGGTIFGQPALAPGRPGEPETLFIAVGKNPLCALNPVNGALYWCDADDEETRPSSVRFADRSAPALGNGHSLYMGNRDNDLWAFNLPPLGTPVVSIDWRHKICTDGDTTHSPTISSNGLIYQASDSLGAGTLVAMCPGPIRQPKWCINPVGGGVRNSAPALSPSEDELYVLVAGGLLVAYDPQTGAKRWEILLENKRSISRNPNFTPVVNPNTGRIYVGLKQGLWVVDRPAVPGGTPTKTLLFNTAQFKQRIESPPALDVIHNRILLGAFKGGRGTLYSLDLNGNIIWQRSDLGRGKFQNNAPVVDVNGRIFFTVNQNLMGLNFDGTDYWKTSFKKRFPTSVILGDKVLYAGTIDGTVWAIGGCAP